MIMEALNIKGFIKMALLVVNGFTFMIMEMSGSNQNTKMELRQVSGPHIMKVEEYGQEAIIKIMKEVGDGSSIIKMGQFLKRKNTDTRY